MVPEYPLTAEEIREKLQRTYDINDRATLIRAVAALLRNGGNWTGAWPTLRHPGNLRSREA